MEANPPRMSETMLVAMKIPTNATPTPRNLRNILVPILRSAQSMGPTQPNTTSVFHTIMNPSAATIRPNGRRKRSGISEAVYHRRWLEKRKTAGAYPAVQGLRRDLRMIPCEMATTRRVSNERAIAFASSENSSGMKQVTTSRTSLKMSLRAATFAL